MTRLQNYMDDGADYQARAVLCFLQGHDEIEESWNDEFKKYMANIEVARWQNCREQGYVVSLNSRNYQKQLNIAFFEHRNSDNICAIEWEQKSINSVTIETAKFGDVYKDKYDVSKSFSHGEVVDMSDWIWDRLVEFWIKTSTEEK